MPPETKALYEFGKFCCDPREHLLLREGKPVSLPPKSFEILLALLQSQGRLLTKDELMQQVWPDAFVEEANLTVNISTLRKVLGESRVGAQQYIETVPKRGYRFIAPVHERQENGNTASPASAVKEKLDPPLPTLSPISEPSLHSQASSRAVNWKIGALLLIVAVLAGVGFLAYRQRTSESTSAPRPRRLAILPFRDLGRDPGNNFLGMSLADAVITKLGYVSSLSVRPSYAIEKYRGQSAELPRVGSDLNVDTVLTGNYLREGDNIRITCQLVDVTSQNLLWKGAFDLKYDKLLTVQDNVAQQIIKGLELTLSPSEAERLKPVQPIDPLAYEYYLRGVDLYSRGEFPLAIKMLERSVEIAPNYALTWAYLGKAHTANASFQFGGTEHYRQAQAAFEKALALEPSQLETSIYMANLFTDTGRVEQAVPLLRKALQTNPNHAEVHWELGYAYRFGGMLDESLAECERARQIDPGVKLTSSALNTYLYLGQYDHFLESLPRTDDSALVTFYRGFGELHQKNQEAAARDFDRAFEINPTVFQSQIGKALSLSIGHQEAKGRGLLHNAEIKIDERGVGDPESIYKIAQAYASLGDHAAALRMLRHSIETGFFPYPYFERDPLLDSLRSEPEFTTIMQSARQRYESFRQAFSPKSP